ncbi:MULTISPECIES: lytic transglycosylase domain-containing protein [Luteimonas]|uniref:Transglycosylase n=1 Tax=Luteimonas chenhongjianii TaxID=2006110 RepID=A0A290XCN6_9GAMM|nr:MULTISPECIES: lytic transglycosylase domain-containing protein [Luteimonas]ATD66859.1 transglycosylase [Luteimonas chenhongjianii]RPD84554.1 lytic transglycosylase domain-containing protein [Luteimonas sp. 100069]
MSPSFSAPRCWRSVVLALALVAAGPAEARTVWRCVKDGTVSLSTAPEPGSKCEARQLADDAVQTPNLWGAMGVFSGVLYEREQDGVLVYGTRRLPGSREYLRFTAQTPPGEPAHEGLGNVGAPRLKPHSALFAANAKRYGLDEAWLRAIAHAESGFDSSAVSPKGARGVMQLMPEVIADYNVSDPYAPAESIRAGAQHLRALLRRYGGDRTLALAAYNAGIGTVARYDGVPPYAETRAYIDKVQALYARYRAALGRPIERPAL